MRFPYRKTFAAVLILVAAIPVVLWTVHQSAPIRALELWYDGKTWATTVGLWGGAAAGLFILLYPPARPFLKIALGTAWRRLGTDRAPLYDGLARLRHLETHDDRLKVGRMAMQLGEMPLAMENLARAYELDPTHLTGRHQFALLLMETGNLEQAIQILQTIVEEDEKHAFGDALLQLGKAHYKLRQDAAAIQALTRHLELFPGSREANLLLARALAETGAMDQARQHLQEAARPLEAEHHLTPTEMLARARAKVTVLRKGGRRD